MSERPSFRKILLIRRKALGDVLVSMRAVLEVARTWPAASVDLVVDRPFADLLDGLAGRADRPGGFRILSWPPRNGQSWLNVLRGGRYDLVIDWLGSPRTALWTMLTGAPVRVGYDLPRRRWAYNVKVPRNRSGRWDLRGFAGEAFLDPLRSLGLDPQPWRDGFAGGSTVGEAVPGSGGSLGNGFSGSFSGEFSNWLENWISGSGAPVVMMMSATWSAKGWPASHAAELFRDLGRRGMNPVLVTGPGDRELEKELRLLLPGDAIAPPTNLLELAHLLEKASVFVGTDCGPRHLAASLGVPTVTLFGPTDPVGWNPAVPEHVSVRTAEDCSPCDLADCPVPGHPCMNDLVPGMVMEAVERVLNPASR
ncbi:MAG: glycosyltransferase family 9 protein [Candidatus Krumholzibacteriota bacterium]